MMERFLEAVTVFADRVLEVGRDPFGDEPLPLFMDGVSLETLEPVTWKHDGEDWVLSNLANQQILFRVFVGLEGLTGRREYRAAAEAATEYTFEHLQVARDLGGETRSHNTGLLWWGTHLAFDLRTRTPIFCEQSGRNPSHELKRCYPYYELMYQVNPARLRRQIESFWIRHVQDWGSLSFNRHGKMHGVADRLQEFESQACDLWCDPYIGGDVFFESSSLTFIEAGTDLAYAAAMLSHLDGDPQPLVWAKRLMHRYVETRHPETGLGGCLFNVCVVQPGTKRMVWEGRGDRASAQLSDVLEGHRVLEGTLCTAGIVDRIVGAALCKLVLSETLGEDGEDFARWAVEDLVAFGTHAFESGTFHPLLTDGTRLSGLVLPRDGYYGKRGASLEPRRASTRALLAYATATRLSEHPTLWEVTRAMFLDRGLGDIGPSDTREPTLRLRTGATQPLCLLAALELWAGTGHEDYRTLAVRIGDNILKKNVSNGFILRNRKRAYVKFNDVAPLALLRLAGALMGKESAVPRYTGSWPSFEARHDGIGSTTDNQLFYGGPS